MSVPATPPSGLIVFPIFKGEARRAADGSRDRPVTLMREGRCAFDAILKDNFA